MKARKSEGKQVPEEQLTNGHLEARKIRMYAWRHSMYQIQYKKDASPDEKAAWEPLGHFFLLKGSIADYVLRCRESEASIKVTRERLAIIDEAARADATPLNPSVLKRRAELCAAISHEETWIEDWKKYISGFREEIAQKRDFYDHLLSCLGINLGDDDLRPANNKIASSGAREYRPEWKRVLCQALLALGIDSSYKQVAAWVSDKFPGVERPICFGAHEERDIGLLILNDRTISKQFQRDLSHMRAEMKQDAANL